MTTNNLVMGTAPHPVHTRAENAVQCPKFPGKWMDREDVYGNFFKGCDPKCLGCKACCNKT